MRKKIIAIIISMAIVGPILFGAYFLHYNNISVYEVLSMFNIYFYSTENCPVDHTNEMKQMYDEINQFAKWNGLMPSFSPYSCDKCPFKEI